MTTTFAMPTVCGPKISAAISLGALALALAMPGAALAAAPAAAPAAPAAPAADTPPAGVTDIVVTAQKRSERLQDVPVAVSSVSGDMLKAANLTNITDIRFLAPSVQFAESNSVRGEGFAIRGVGTFAFADGTEQSVSVVVDGVVLGRPGMGTGDLADVAQVDVLRGPQGMLFGKGGSAGVVSISTRNPTQNFEGSARVSYGTDNETKLEGVLNVPLTENLAWRTTGYFNHRDGFINNVYTGQTLGGQSEGGFRTKLLFKPDSDLSVLASFDWGHHSSACCQSVIVGTVGAAPNNYVVQRLAAYNIVPSLDNRETNVGGPVYLNMTQWGGSLQIDKSIGDYTLTSITAFRRWVLHDNTDTGFTDTPFFPINGADEAQQQLTQELRLASPKRGLVDYVVGLYYFNQNLKAAYPQQGQLGLPASTAVYSRKAQPDIQTLNYALFGQGNINLTPTWKLIVGGRYTHDDLTMIRYNRTLVSPTDNAFPGAPPLSFDQTTYPSNRKADNFSYKLGTEYKITPDVMTYFTYSRGYKGPGIGLVSGYLLGQPLFSNPEIPTNYEVGLKTAWFNRRLVFNIDAYTTDIKDFQTQISTPFIFNGTNLAILQIANAGKVRSRGIEMDFSARPTDRLTISGNAAYIDAKFAYFPNGTCNYPTQPGCFVSTTIPGTTTTVPATRFFNNTGNVLPNSPKFTYSLNANYDVPVTSEITGFIKANYNYRSSVNFSANGDPLTYQRGYGIAGGQIGVRDADGRWNVAVFARNLFNTRFVTAISNNGSYQTAWLTTQAMRTIGVLGDVKF
ncbi:MULTISPECIES: TonB-dependent receptor [unclassified Novosphingobium]|uniref:TonB-dependent receptor n=1 Tax=unclassified Novosphingobium TaxID=2644732 RepID=UPI0014945EF3|nr:MULTISPECIES: TonB-dependent receptor [unclassified Novosphingobium]MBB3358222.1 iron complex outermembrane receptor protein [Novosphingobium sp. BK256]MBB3374583.1 iron complex outermembrane receptor protein [Novosphingobium sp. BK280]MBB3378995.1 iron complex outermembrane receptor protein [Novosphingobium sp. BK258]MBB3420689.1 iron complex outermembrane receptor protein [Novosphingobium sp. BK267]MBB3448189.1 iron complex outermembrane receptor protein [Novosphingobium sp. BK352]